MSSAPITIQTTFQSPINTIWHAWTDAATMLQWFGSDPDGQGLSAEADARPCKGFRVSFRDSSGMEHTCFGTYLTVTPPHELSFTWCWQNEPGVTSQVLIKLQQSGTGTLMHFEHNGVGTASAHNYLAGWTSTFEKLRRVVEKGE
jgi:uncharacterized protein YndB with AHSA1/START domain